MFLANICYGSVKGECRKGWEGMFMGGREWMPSENKSVFFNFKEAMSRGRSESHPCIYNALTAQWNRWAPKCPELTGPVRAPGLCRPHPASSLSCSVAFASESDLEGGGWDGPQFLRRADQVAELLLQEKGRLRENSLGVFNPLKSFYLTFKWIVPERIARITSQILTYIMTFETSDCFSTREQSPL